MVDLLIARREHMSRDRCLPAVQRLRRPAHQRDRRPAELGRVVLFPAHRVRMSDTSRRTLAHYDERAEAFREGTRDHDVSQNIAALLRHIEGDAAVHDPRSRLRTRARPRDASRAIGHERDRPRRLGARSPRWRARTAAARCGSRTSSRSICPPARFDGVFANASLFHVPRSELPRVLRELHATLKPRGVLFSSNPRGDERGGLERRALRRVARPRHLARAS